MQPWSPSRRTRQVRLTLDRETVRTALDPTLVLLRGIRLNEVDWWLPNERYRAACVGEGR